LEFQSIIFALLHVTCISTGDTLSPEEFYGNNYICLFKWTWYDIGLHLVWCFSISRYKPIRYTDILSTIQCVRIPYMS